MASSPKDKFDAAVKVIRGLPKDGAFQPSHELMLKFYSYYKQATEGPCTSPKPAFWDLVNKRKWEAWSNLGDMQREEAMLLYVDELKKVSIHVREVCYPPQIVETMPQTEAVTEFLQKLDHFYEMVEDSENHNTLKMPGKPRLNGSVGANGLNESGGDDEEEELNTSYNVAQLLKRDLRLWQDRSGLVTGGSSATNGHSSGFKHEENSISHQQASSDDDEDNNDNNDDDDEITEKVEVKQTGGKPRAGSASTEEWEQVDDSRVSASQSDSYGDSESENDEFCDTSNDPVELALPTSAQTFASSLPTLTEAPSISSPVSGGKSVHFDSGIDGKELGISDNLTVDVSMDADKALELSSYLHLEDDGHSGDLIISTCRGGEEQERERSRRGGNLGSRDAAASGSRGGHDGSGDTGGSNPGGGGRRDLFPGPGGGGGWRGPGAGGVLGPSDLNEQIVVTLLRLQHDMSGVLNRLNSLETLVKESRKEKDKAVRTRKGWWPFPDLSVKSALVIFVWPLLVHCIITYISRRQRKFNR